MAYDTHSDSLARWNGRRRCCGARARPLGLESALEGSWAPIDPTGSTGRNLG